MKTSSGPSQSPADVGGPGPGTITRLGFSLVRGLNRAADDSLNRRQMARFLAAGGEVRGPDPNRPIGRNNPPGYYFGGRRISEDRARAIQREYRDQPDPNEYTGRLETPIIPPEPFPRQSPIRRPPRSQPTVPGPAPGPPMSPPIMPPGPPFEYNYQPPYRGEIPNRGSDTDVESGFWLPDRFPIYDPTVQTFAPGNFPMPQPVKIPLPTVLPTILRTVIGVLGWILYPSRTADDDTIPEAEPAPIPKGPPRRPRVGRPQPYGWPEPDWYNYARRRRPRMPGVLWPRTDVPGRPAPWEYPEPAPGTVPADRPGTRPGRRELPRGDPFPTGRPTPAPVSRPAPFDPVPWLLPFLRPGLRPARPGARPGVPRPDVSNPFGPAPLTPSEPRGVDSPLQFEQPQFRADRCPPCDCSKTDRKRKRKKDSCTNPISSKRTFTRGSARFRTITRKLQCPV